MHLVPRLSKLFGFFSYALNVTYFGISKNNAYQDGSFEYSQHNNEPRHEISNDVVCGTSTGSDQPVHTRSLIRAFASGLNIL